MLGYDLEDGIEAKSYIDHFALDFRRDSHVALFTTSIICMIAEFGFCFEPHFRLRLAFESHKPVFYILIILNLYLAAGGFIRIKIDDRSQIKFLRE